MTKRYCDFCEQELTEANTEQVKGTTYYALRSLRGKKFAFALSLKANMSDIPVADVCKPCFNEAFELTVRAPEQEPEQNAA